MNRVEVVSSEITEPTPEKRRTFLNLTTAASSLVKELSIFQGIQLLRKCHFVSNGYYTCQNNALLVIPFGIVLQRASFADTRFSRKGSCKSFVVWLTSFKTLSTSDCWGSEECGKVLKWLSRTKFGMEWNRWQKIKRHPFQATNLSSNFLERSLMDWKKVIQPVNYVITGEKQSLEEREAPSILSQVTVRMIFKLFRNSEFWESM